MALTDWGHGLRSCLVFGTLAAESASSYASEISHISVTLTQAGTQMKEAYAACRPFGTDRNRHTPPIPASLSQPPAVFICRRVRELMWQHAGILRSMENLKNTLDEINSLALLADTCCRPDSCAGPRQLQSFLKAHQYTDLSRALLIAMMEEMKAAAATTGKMLRIQMTPIICTASVLALKRTSMMSGKCLFHLPPDRQKHTGGGFKYFIFK